MKWMFAVALSLSLISASVAKQPEEAASQIRPAMNKRNFVDLWRQGSLTVTGTWTTVDLKDLDNLVGYPINYSQLTCHRDFKMCSVAETIIASKDWFDLSVEEWEITQTSDKEIVATRKSQCITKELTINIPRQEVFVIEREGGYTDDNCVNERKNKLDFFSPLTRPRVLVLQDSDVAIPNDPRMKMK